MTPLKTSFASLSEYCWECHACMLFITVSSTGVLQGRLWCHCKGMDRKTAALWDRRPTLGAFLCHQRMRERERERRNPTNDQIRITIFQIKLCVNSVNCTKVLQDQHTLMQHKVNKIALSFTLFLCWFECICLCF